MVEPLNEKHQIDFMAILRKNAAKLSKHLDSTKWKEQLIKDVFHSSKDPL